MKNKICFIYPNLRWLKTDIITTWNLNPSTLCLLGAMVKDMVDVEIIDAQFYNVSKEDFQKQIKTMVPKYIGISLLTSEYHDVLEIVISLIKEVLENVVIIVGGVHITTQAKLVMENKHIDYGVLGEGEFVLQRLIKHLENNTDFPNEGLAYRDDNSNVVIQPQALVENLSSLPWPDYSLVNFREYVNIPNREHGTGRPPAFPFIRITVTRGCPFGCTFCQVENISGKKVRTRDPKDVVAELLYLKNEYGIKSIIFDDDNMLMGEKRFAKRLFEEMIEKELNLPWIGTAFALFLMTDELIELMAKSGCVGINVAVESGNARVIKEIVKKPIKDLSMVPQIIQKVKDNGMWCIANFIIGFPGETWEEIRETIRYAENCNADYVKFFNALPIHGTKLYQIAEDMGALEHNDGMQKLDWRYASVKSEEWTAKDITILRAYEWDRINFSPERIEKTAEIWGISIDEIRKIRKNTRDALEF